MLCCCVRVLLCCCVAVWLGSGRGVGMPICRFDFDWGRPRIADDDSTEAEVLVSLDVASSCLTLFAVQMPYHADNGRFAESSFRDAVDDSNQTITFCGVGAHHQNAIVERMIKSNITISDHLSRPKLFKSFQSIPKNKQLTYLLSLSMIKLSFIFDANFWAGRLLYR